MKGKRSLAIFLFCLSMMVTIVTMVREHTAPVHDPFQATTNITAANDNAPRLSQQRSRHILYGDHTGGGHLYGVNALCKSEFPMDWSAEEIIAAVKTLAANDNMRWSRAKNGYYTAEHWVRGVQIRVVLDREKDDIITAYPVNRPRNDCPPQ